MISEQPRFQWVAHRGYPSRYPENTMPGFEKAIEAGALLLETDVQISADGVPVLFHDQTLSRLCGVSGVIHHTPMNHLERLSAFDPARFGNRHKGVRIPTLADMVRLLQRNPAVTLYLEIKHIGLTAFGVDEVLRRVGEVIAPVVQQVVLISFSLFALRAASQRGWERLGPVLQRWGDLQHPVIKKVRPEVVFISHRRIPLGVHYAPSDCQLACYETSDYGTAVNLAARGATLIETDAIGEMLAATRADSRFSSESD